MRQFRPFSLLARVSLVAGLFLAVTAGPPFGAPAAESVRNESRPAAHRLVVIELFTSQGCGACVDSNALMGKLAASSDILPLTFHVDYWDYIGWADPFGNRAFTERQHNYALSFGRRYLVTPEFIVDGYEDLRATSIETLTRLAERALSTVEHRVPIAFSPNADGSATLNVGSGVADGRVTMWLINFDRRRTTPVHAGENNGIDVTTYNVVTRIAYLGTWVGDPIELRLDPSRLNRVRAGGLAVVLQPERMGRILGAAALQWDDSGKPTNN